MFSLTKFIFGAPLLLLLWIGQPFKLNLDTAYRNYSNNDIKLKFETGRSSHYGERVFFSAVCIVAILVFLFMIWATDGHALWILPLILLVTGLVDGTLLLSRYVYYEEVKKQESNGTEIVSANFWKDDSLETLIKKANKERAEVDAMKLKRGY